MKILITTGIYPPEIGGPATHVFQVAEELRLRGHLVTVVTLGDAGGELVPTVYRVPRGSFVALRMLRTVATIVRLGAAHDVIYVQGLWIEAAIANAWLRKPMVRKIVGDWAWERAYGRGWMNESFDDFQKSSHGIPVGLCKFLRGALTRRADRVIVPSDYLGRCVLGWGVPTERVRVIANAIENNYGEIAQVMARQSRRVVTAGRLTRWKGFEDVIAALAALPDAELVIIGDGPERERLERRAEKEGVSSRVFFRGRLTREQVVAELAAAAAFVLNSSYEGFPHIVLEAFQAGTPVIAADVGGVGEIIHHEENGLLIPQGDVMAIRAALLRIFNAPELPVRLREGGRKALERYTSSLMVQGIENTLAEALQQHGRRGASAA